MAPGHAADRRHHITMVRWRGPPPSGYGRPGACHTGDLQARSGVSSAPPCYDSRTFVHDEPAMSDDPTHLPANPHALPDRPMRVLPVLTRSPTACASPDTRPKPCTTAGLTHPKVVALAREPGRGRVAALDGAGQVRR